MRCTNKKRQALVLVMVLALLVSGCGKKQPDPNAYRIYESSYNYRITAAAPVEEVPLFAGKLCIAGDKDIGTKKVDSSVAEAGAVFNNTTRDTVYAQNVYDKMYPASTTKILTAYLAIKYGNLDEVYTVSEHACDQAYDSSVAKLSPGDQMTLRDLLYGLMLASGNDAAIAIAEGMDGDEATFVKRMNEEAKKLGATKSHFVTPNGLHDEEHYTTAYDMYLIYSAALEKKAFRKLISATEYTSRFKGAGGAAKELTWTTTNGYLTGDYKMPGGITVVGGKTGTTGQAGYCLVLLSENEKKEQLVSIVFHADCRSNLYHLMSQILAMGK